jgi:tetratricopeptide (TPR) repeat protein
MIKPIKICSLLLLLFTVSIAFGQTDKEKAKEMKNEAIKLMDNGQVDESLKILKEAKKLDPENLDYDYEMAFAYTLKRDYKEAIKILEKNLDHKGVTDQVYQMIGNNYDYLGKSGKALDAYDAGLKRFPNSGKLYLEKGNVYLIKKEYGKALPFYEKGIQVDPTFPSNYYRLALLFCSSKEPLWGLMYGELFLNLEHGTKRFFEVGKLLFDTYKAGIKINGDSMKFDFCNIVMQVEDIINKNQAEIKFPFCMPFSQAFGVALVNAKTIDINTLNTIRTTFVDVWYKMKNNEKYPNVLYEYQEKVRAAGHLEAYNHYILAGADTDAFKEWASANQEKFTGFMEWFKDNQLSLDTDHKFYRGQY